MNDDTNETLEAEVETNPLPQLKKYSCADVEADLADQIMPRSKKFRVTSGAYLSQLLREAFEREDRIKGISLRDLNTLDARESARPVHVLDPIDRKTGLSPSFPSEAPAKTPPEPPLDAAIRRAAAVAAASEALSRKMRDFLNRQIRDELERGRAT
jgi:hypothetical protein